MLYNVALVLLYNEVSQLCAHMIPLALEPPSCIPHPHPAGHHRALGWAPVWYNRFPLALYFTHGSVYMFMLLSQLAPPSLFRSVSFSFSTYRRSWGSQRIGHSLETEQQPWESLHPSNGVGISTRLISYWFLFFENCLPSPRWVAGSPVCSMWPWSLSYPDHYPTRDAEWAKWVLSPRHLKFGSEDSHMAEAGGVAVFCRHEHREQQKLILGERRDRYLGRGRTAPRETVLLGPCAFSSWPQTLKYPCWTGVQEISWDPSAFSSIIWTEMLGKHWPKPPALAR